MAEGLGGGCHAEGEQGWQWVVLGKAVACNQGNNYGDRLPIGVGMSAVLRNAVSTYLFCFRFLHFPKLSGLGEWFQKPKPNRKPVQNQVMQMSHEAASKVQSISD